MCSLKNCINFPEGIAAGVTRNELGCIATYSFFLTSVPSFDI